MKTLGDAIHSKTETIRILNQIKNQIEEHLSFIEKDERALLPLLKDMNALRAQLCSDVWALEQNRAAVRRDLEREDIIKERVA